MKTQYTIDKLISELKPVKPIIPLNWALGWLFITVTFIFTAVYIETDSFKNLYIPIYMYDIFLMFGAGLFSAFATIYLGIPGEKKGIILKWIAFAFFMSWAAVLLMRFMNILPNLWTIDRLEKFHQPHTCVENTVFLSLIPTALLFLMSLKLNSPQHKWSSYFIFLGPLALSSAAVQWMCPNESSIHLIIGHFLPVLIASIVGLLAGKEFLKW